MIVTRTETYTDWVYQGAHAGEQAAWIGRGLLKGSIYFRYAYDFLNKGDTVTREVSHVHLSDGSTYELGTGLSSEKITISYEGQTDSNEVTLRVDGKLGIGVSSITRNVTISYDDGKVPVLDTDQLEGVLDELSSSLTASMKDTAEVVKTELRNELSTKLIDLEEKVDGKLKTQSDTIGGLIDEKVTAGDLAVKTELTQATSDLVSSASESLRSEITTSRQDVLSELQSARSALEQKIEQGDTKLRNDLVEVYTSADSALKSELTSVISQSVNSLRTSLTDTFTKADDSYFTRTMHEVDTRIKIGRWNLGQYSIASGQFNNTLSAAPSSTSQGDPVFGHDSTNKSLVLNTSLSMRNRILRLTYTANINTPDGYNGFLSLVLKDINDTNLARNTHALLRDSGLMSLMTVYQFTVDYFIRANDETNPVFNGGVRVEFGNNGPSTVILNTGATLDMMLFTAG